LFKAYNNAGTPRNIDPWIVTVLSPDTQLLRELRLVLATDGKLFHVSGETGKRTDLPNATVENQTVGAFFVRRDWVLHVSSRKMPLERQLRTWRQFKDNIEALAA